MRTSKLYAVGFVLVLASVLLAQPSLAQQQQETFQKTFTVTPGSALNVENYKGRIYVTATDGNQVTVDGQKRFTGSDSDRKWWMENVKIDFRNDPHRVEIKIEYPNCSFCFHDYYGEVDLNIRVPRQTNVSLDGYKPDIKISGVKGDIAVKSYKSPMLIEDTTGAISIHTYKDTIHLSNVRINGALEVKSYKADVDVIATDLGQTADLESYKGGIAIHVPRDAGLDLDYAGGRRSSFHSDFNLAVASGSSESIRGTINGGGTKLRLHTVRGSVSLQKMSGEL
jgi:hypothetical protein